MLEVPRRIAALYLSPDGRITRPTYIMSLFGLAVVIVLSSLIDPTGVLGGLLAAWPLTVVLAKRLQDFGVPGIPVALLIVGGQYAVTIRSLVDIPMDGFATALQILGGLVGLYALFTKGEPGKNRYGDDPLGRPPEP